MKFIIMRSLTKEFFIMQHREELIKLSLEKAQQALKSAQDNINLNNL